MGRLLLAVIVAATISGCSGGTDSEPVTTTTEPTTTTTHTTAPAVFTALDPHWMGIEPSQPWNWTEQERRISGEFQQFGFRPSDETELPRGCNGCGVDPPTAFVTVYEPGAFDPGAAQGGAPTHVGGVDAYFTQAQGDGDAMLAWRYEPDAWATVRGTTTATSGVDAVRELAQALRPAERSPATAPVTLTQLPETMPLSGITVDHGPYGTTLWFAPCAMTDEGAVPDCMTSSPSFEVRILPADEYDGHVDVADSVPMTIGDTEGIYVESTQTAAVQLAPGVLVVFTYSDPDVTAPPRLPDILASVKFASDPANEDTWPSVSDWVK